MNFTVFAGLNSDDTEPVDEPAAGVLGNATIEYLGGGLFKGIEYGALGKEIADRNAAVISMTKQRSYRATVPLDGVETLQEAQAILAGAQWLIARDEGYQDESLWGHQHYGGEFFGTNNTWTKFGSTEPVFTVIPPTVVLQGDSGYALQLEFSNDYLFTSMQTNGGRAPAGVGRTNSPQILDYVGYYDFMCLDSEGNVLGQSEIRYTVYDSFRTMAEVYPEIDAVVGYVEETYPVNGIGMYMEKRILATSPGGNDMPCIIIADAEASLGKYQVLKEKMEADPAAYRAALAEGEGPLYEAIMTDYKYPILVTQVHSDEITSTDAILEFVWRIARSHENGTEPGDIEFKTMDSYKDAGKLARDVQLNDMRKTTLSELFYDADGTPWSEFLGYVNGPGNYNIGQQSFSSFSSPIDLNYYYNMATNKFNVKELLDNFIFLIIPTEEPDGRVNMAHANENGFDQNRDHSHQTQPEATAAARMIANWNPIATFMICVYHNEYLIEPCTPPHEPNLEYDLFAKKGMQLGEAFGKASVSNNPSYNAFKMPMRDSLETNDGVKEWGRNWDDICTNYIPSYGILHGSMGITIETVNGNDDTIPTIPYGLFGAAYHLMETDYDYLDNQLAIYERGVNNVDADSVRPFFVDYNDKPSADAAAFRPKFEENNNFFPEYYVIPADAANQKNLAAAFEMQHYFMENGVKVDTLDSDQTVTDAYGEQVSIKAGSFIINMRQAKRSFINSTMYSSLLITDNWPALYAEQAAAFGYQRDFDYYTITKAGAFSGELTRVNVPKLAETAFSGAAGFHVVIKNIGLEAIRAVNHLLDEGVRVGFITSGAEKGHFVVSYDDFIEALDGFALTVVGTKAAPQARVIEKPTLFVPGINHSYASAAGRGEYGRKGNFSNSLTYWDRFALRDQMGFDVIDDPDFAQDADIIIGSANLSAAQVGIVKNDGTSYIAIGAGMPNIRASFFAADEFSFTPTAVTSRVIDHIFRTEYPSDSLVTASYRSYGEGQAMYGYGGRAIQTIPEGANVLIKAAVSEPDKPAVIMGSFLTEKIPQLLDFEGSIQAFEYVEDGLDITVFANTLTHKAHQQGDYGYAANAIYSRMLGEDYAEPSSDATLNTLIVSAGTLVPAFNTETMEYTVSVANSVSSITISAAANHVGATVEGIGTKNLAVGANIFTIAVTAEDGTVNEYTVTVTRAGGGGYGGGSTSGGGGAPATIVEPTVPLADLIPFAPFITGFENNTFRGSQPITREQFVAILYRLNVANPAAYEGDSSFKDVSTSRWSYDAIEWASGAGVVEADANGNFRPAAPLTRGDMAVMFMKVEDLSEMAENIFSDIEDHYAAEDILKAVEVGIFNGYPDGTFKPEGSTTRSEAVAALIRYLMGGEPTDATWQNLTVTFTDVPKTDWAYKYIVLAVIGNTLPPR
ncbi:MAG: S-layer homology domain-containing protein [Clostridiales bacterium]|nr:S-layer homology domain-containing protein [Clostridiales bacterium]